MLVVARTFEPAEVKAAHNPSAPMERYYTVQHEGLSTTLVDVTDHRARKTIHYDALTQSNTELVESVVVPFTVALTEMGQACQATIVVDGSLAARREVLFGVNDGLIQSALVLLRQQPLVNSVFISAVTLADGNHLEDTLDLASADEGESSEPTVMEDTRDRFTSIESAHYEELTSESTVQRLLAFLESRVSGTRHQIYSIIVTFTDPVKMPNTTMQFVSFAVNEVARDMKSTRYCVSTAATHIETSAPVQSFNGTKLSFLLKPVLLGHQPGAYVACFSPISVVAADSERETFKEAFCVAQTLTRLYDSRAGLFSTTTPATTSGEARPSLPSSPVVAWRRPRLSRSPSSSSVHRDPSARQVLQSTSAVPHDGTGGATRVGGYSPVRQQLFASVTGVSRDSRRDLAEVPPVSVETQRPATSLERRLDALERENAYLRETQRRQEVWIHHSTPTHAQGDTRIGTAAGPSSDIRALVEMIQQQQEEIRQHVVHEERYRLRILELEDSLRARTEQVTLLTGAMRDRREEPAQVTEHSGVIGTAPRGSIAKSPPRQTQELVQLRAELDTEKERRVRAERTLAERSQNAVEEVRSALMGQMSVLQEELDHVRTELSGVQGQGRTRRAPLSPPPATAPLPTRPRGGDRGSRFADRLGSDLVSPRAESARANTASTRVRPPSASATASRQNVSYDVFMRDDPQYRMRHSSTPRNRRTQ